MTGRAGLQTPWKLAMGANVTGAGETCFRVSAPRATTVDVLLCGAKRERLAMQRDSGDVFSITLPNVTGTDYMYVVDGEKERPDPVSRWQPQGVHGPSRIYDPLAFPWDDASWKNPPLCEYVVYELHVGTFTETGTFDGVIERLPHLQDLGITAIELMPVIEYPGDRDWGYDGVNLYAPHHAYGGPEGLKRLVAACHRAGVAVILDVVYNHLGPEGNYLQDFGFYFTDRYKTPWGDAINFDGAYSDPVRRLFCDNALYWLTEYHIDALRLDAVFAIYDFSSSHILKDISIAVHRQAKALKRDAYLIAESDLNDPKIVRGLQGGGYSLDAQWNDEFHHSLLTSLSDNRWRYLADFGQVSQFVKALRKGYVYDGQWSPYRKKTFGASSESLRGDQLVVFIQNHDQVGNATQGKRLHDVVGLQKCRLMALMLSSAPYIPLLFMGQEWNATTPFLFFTSYGDAETVKNVEAGYKKWVGVAEQFGLSVNPQDPKRRDASRLRWEELQGKKHADMLAYYKALLVLRKTTPCLCNCRKDLTTVEEGPGKSFVMLRRDVGPSLAICVANFGEEEQEILVKFPEGLWRLEVNSSVSPGTKAPPEHLQADGASEHVLCVPPYSALLYVY